MYCMITACPYVLLLCILFVICKISQYTFADIFIVHNCKYSIRFWNFTKWWYTNAILTSISSRSLELSSKGNLVIPPSSAVRQSRSPPPVPRTGPDRPRNSTDQASGSSRDTAPVSSRVFNTLCITIMDKLNHFDYYILLK